MAVNVVTVLSTQVSQHKKKTMNVKNASIILCIIRLLIKQEKDVIMNVDADKSTYDNVFVDGLCTMPCGMNTVTAQDIVSPTMAHLLTTLD